MSIPLGQEKKGFSKVLRMSPGESKGKFTEESKIFRVKWDQKKGTLAWVGLMNREFRSLGPSIDLDRLIVTTIIIFVCFFVCFIFYCTYSILTFHFPHYY